MRDYPIYLSKPTMIDFTVEDPAYVEHEIAEAVQRRHNAQTHRSNFRGGQLMICYTGRLQRRKVLKTIGEVVKENMYKKATR